MKGGVFGWSFLISNGCIQSVAWLWHVRLIYHSLFLLDIFWFLTWVQLEQVLLGESPGCELENSFPSKAGLVTVLEVLKIQMKFWPSLGPIFVNLESQWRMYCFEKKSKELSLVYLLNFTTLFLLDLVLFFYIFGLVGHWWDLLVGMGEYLIVCSTNILCALAEFRIEYF